jgi:hypothetical protein
MRSGSKRKKRPARAPFLHRSVEYKMAMFLQQFPPKEFNREFRNMFLDYLAYHRGMNYRVDREMMIEGVWDLMRVLDEAEDQWEYRDIDEIINKYNGR